MTTTFQDARARAEAAIAAGAALAPDAARQCGDLLASIDRAVHVFTTLKPTEEMRRVHDQQMRFYAEHCLAIACALEKLRAPLGATVAPNARRATEAS